jgi:hypothetical protein
MADNYSQFNSHSSASPKYFPLSRQMVLCSPCRPGPGPGNRPQPAKNTPFTLARDFKETFFLKGRPGSNRVALTLFFMKWVSYVRSRYQFLDHAWQYTFLNQKKGQATIFALRKSCLSLFFCFFAYYNNFIWPANAESVRSNPGDWQRAWPVLPFFRR